jgi:hypothetical protein
MRTQIKLVVLSLVLASSTGCSILGQDRRDAPWDPKPGQSLMDQIPNEDGGANRRCCGHLRECKPYQSPRC